MQAKVDILRKISAALSAGDRAEASTIARADYPFVARKPVRRVYTDEQSVRIFLRDGYVDRYTGERLIFPGALRLISQLLPSEFPIHPNWKMSECHMAYWELIPTIDHLIPIARGGLDEESNWITTSMLRNSAKAQWTLEELGWSVFPPGDLHVWDGLSRWFLDYLRIHPLLLKEANLKRWHAVATRCAKPPNQTSAYSKKR
jgi:hypothetical protein